MAVNIGHKSTGNGRFREANLFGQLAALGYQETFGITNSQQIEGLLPDVKRALRCLAFKVGCVSKPERRQVPL
jgi:hypothetical protein